MGYIQYLYPVGQENGHDHVMQNSGEGFGLGIFIGYARAKGSRVPGLRPFTTCKTHPAIWLREARPHG